MKISTVMTGVLALASLTACASSSAPTPYTVTSVAPATASGHDGGWMVVAAAPAVGGSHEQLGISRQPVMSNTGVLMGGGYIGPVPEEPHKAEEKYNALRVRVVGYGAPPNNRSLTPVQRRLLAMRASQLDAYRAVAEQVQGFRLSGNSSVGNMVATNDSFRVFVDAYLRGVRVLSTEFKPDGSSESIAEVVLDESFFKAYRTALTSSGNVAMAAGMMRDENGMALGCTGNGCVSESGHGAPSH